MTASKIQETSGSSLKKETAAAGLTRYVGNRFNNDYAVVSTVM